MRYQILDSSGKQVKVIGAGLAEFTVPIEEAEAGKEQKLIKSAYKLACMRYGLDPSIYSYKEVR